MHRATLPPITGSRPDTSPGADNRTTRTASSGAGRYQCLIHPARVSGQAERAAPATNAATMRLRDDRVIDVPGRNALLCVGLRGLLLLERHAMGRRHRVLR
jgi:hypothetical protein